MLKSRIIIKQINETLNDYFNCVKNLIFKNKVLNYKFMLKFVCYFVLFNRIRFYVFYKLFSFLRLLFNFYFII